MKLCAWSSAVIEVGLSLFGESGLKSYKLPFPHVRYCLSLFGESGLKFPIAFPIPTVVVRSLPVWGEWIEIFHVAVDDKEVIRLSLFGESGLKFG